jgi:hypothetical protein
MQSRVANAAKRNQVLLRIVTSPAAEFLVVDLKVGQCAARLASPTVAAEHLLAQLFIQFLIEPQACTFR